jgi:hypothetical protein
MFIFQRVLHIEMLYVIENEVFIRTIRGYLLNFCLGKLTPDDVYFNREKETDEAA